MEKLTKREKIILGVAVVGVAAAGYFGYKHIKTANLYAVAKDVYAKESKERMKLHKKCATLSDELSSLKFLISESGCVPKSLQNAENKLARRETKIKELCETLLKRPNSDEIKVAISKHEKDAARLRYQINKAYELNKRLMNDEVVY